MISGSRAPNIPFDCRTRFLGPYCLLKGQAVLSPPGTIVQPAISSVRVPSISFSPIDLDDENPGPIR
jgi:hypothetical protein